MGEEVPKGRRRRPVAPGPYLKTCLLHPPTPSKNLRDTEGSPREESKRPVCFSRTSGGSYTTTVPVTPPVQTQGPPNTPSEKGGWIPCDPVSLFVWISNNLVTLNSQQKYPQLSRTDYMDVCGTPVPVNNHKEQKRHRSTITRVSTNILLIYSLFTQKWTPSYHETKRKENKSVLLPFSFTTPVCDDTRLPQGGF